MEFPAQLSSLQPILDFLRTSLVASEELQKKLELAVEEVVVNIISYSHSSQISMEVREEHGMAFITIKDWGDPFNPLDHREEKQDQNPVEAMKEGGLGIFFLKKLMDEVTYERSSGQNILRMKKNLFHAEEATG
ncbi:MAG: ATP-binding protein [Simkaniaceae bacterium]|nr:ATP-binding protein [Simkaniaceae bacterium]